MHLFRSTPVTRSWTRTLTALTFALVMLGLGCFLAYVNRTLEGLIGTLIFLICFFAGLLTAMTHSYTGICPACGSPQKRLGGIHRCDHCLAYGEVVKGEYWTRSGSRRQLAGVRGAGSRSMFLPEALLCLRRSCYAVPEAAHGS